MRNLMIARMNQLKKQNGSYFDLKKVNGIPLNEYDLETVDDSLLIEIFEFMVKANYTQR